MERHCELAVSGAAKRRRERRLRQWHRYERLTVQMALCEAEVISQPQGDRRRTRQVLESGLVS